MVMREPSLAMQVVLPVVNAPVSMLARLERISGTGVYDHGRQTFQTAAAGANE
jgi:hypothetical protein